MGEIADLMIDGTLCSECGSVMTDGVPGIPGRCPDCRSGDKKPRHPDKRRKGKHGPNWLSPAMRQMLQNLKDGGSICCHLSGRSQFGGADKTIQALHRREFIAWRTVGGTEKFPEWDWVLTDRGREVIDGKK